MVDEETAFEMIQLMLHHGRKQSFRVEFLIRAFPVEMTHAHPRRPLYVLEIVGHR